ncbi:MAG TPA: TspO/MBR family protein [Patescibacteria group bacterium]|nr:TspO/MBR family protein [Patescibacteria group bacterium]
MFFFAIQWLLNIGWSFCFFYLRSPLLGFIEIIILLISIIITIFYFYRINKLAGYLFIPYLYWVTFAAILNFSIWFLN